MYSFWHINATTCLMTVDELYQGPWPIVEQSRPLLKIWPSKLKKKQIMEEKNFERLRKVAWGESWWSWGRCWTELVRWIPIPSPRVPFHSDFTQALAYRPTWQRQKKKKSAVQGLFYSIYYFISAWLDHAWRMNKTWQEPCTCRVTLCFCPLINSSFRFLFLLRFDF